MSVLGKLLYSLLFVHSHQCTYFIDDQLEIMPDFNGKHNQ